MRSICEPTTCSGTCTVLHADMRCTGYALVFPLFSLLVGAYRLPIRRLLQRFQVSGSTFAESQ